MKSEENLLSNTNTKTEAKTFNKSLFKIVAPIAIQNFITCAVNSVDVFMLGLVSQTAIASVSLASRVQFLLGMFFTGESFLIHLNHHKYQNIYLENLLLNKQFFLSYSANYFL